MRAKTDTLFRRPGIGTLNDDSDTVSELNHVVGGVTRSNLVQSGQDTSLDVVKGWSEHSGT